MRSVSATRTIGDPSILFDLRGNDGQQPGVKAHEAA
jgi:hypothetical protein